MERREFMKFLGVVGAASIITPAIASVFKENDAIKVIPMMRPFAENSVSPGGGIDMEYLTKCKTQADVNKHCRLHDMGLGRDENFYCYVGDGKWLPFNATVKSIFDE